MLHWVKNIPDSITLEAAIELINAKNQPKRKENLKRKNGHHIYSGYSWCFILAKNQNLKKLNKNDISCCWAGTVYDLDHNPEMEEEMKIFFIRKK